MHSLIYTRLTPVPPLFYIPVVKLASPALLFFWLPLHSVIFHELYLKADPGFLKQHERCQCWRFAVKREAKLSRHRRIWANKNTSCPHKKRFQVRTATLHVAAFKANWSPDSHLWLRFLRSPFVSQRSFWMQSSCPRWLRSSNATLVSSYTWSWQEARTVEKTYLTQATSDDADKRTVVIRYEWKSFYKWKGERFWTFRLRDWSSQSACSTNNILRNMNMDV